MRFLITLGLVSLPVFAQDADFRKTAWGMTQAQVIAAEPARPAEIREAGGEVVLRYDAAQLGGLKGRLVYILAKNKLVRAKYIFDAEHSNQNDFIADYRAVEPVLMETYGKPANERAVWTDDSTQDEPKSYLDQDRASPSNILPSDKLVGFAVSLGHLKLYTQWQTPRTKILHALTGENYNITHQVEYLSVDLEAFEREVRK